MIDPFEAANFNSLAVYPKPVITKDGVTVATHINLLNDSLENIGSRLLIDAAERTNEESGDGTTSCTVIARSFLENGKKFVQTGS